MKPCIFDYRAPKTLKSALEDLSAHPNSKILAGGQSLVPMMNFRLVTPDLLIDINGIEELKGIEGRGQSLRIGALASHYEVEASKIVADRFPVISRAMTHVGHLAIRNRGTIGGSLVHADPAAEWPLLATLLNARISLASAKGSRSLKPHEFFAGALTTRVRPDEVVTHVDFPALPKKAIYVFDEFAKRSGDFALCAVAISLSFGGHVLTGGKRITDARIAIGGVSETAIRAAEAERLLKNRKSIDQTLINSIAQRVSDEISPNNDLHASGDYRRALCRALLDRSLKKAATLLEALEQ